MDSTQTNLQEGDIATDAETCQRTDLLHLTAYRLQRTARARIGVHSLRSTPRNGGRPRPYPHGSLSRCQTPMPLLLLGS